MQSTKVYTVQSKEDILREEVEGERTMNICALETDKDAVGGTKTVNVGDETEIMRKISQ